jgi:hypothetical protein
VIDIDNNSVTHNNATSTKSATPNTPLTSKGHKVVKVVHRMTNAVTPTLPPQSCTNAAAEMLNSMAAIYSPNQVAERKATRHANNVHLAVVADYQARICALEERLDQTTESLRQETQRADQAETCAMFAKRANDMSCGFDYGYRPVYSDHRLNRYRPPPSQGYCGCCPHTPHQYKHCGYLWSPNADYNIDINSPWRSSCRDSAAVEDVDIIHIDNELDHQRLVSPASISMPPRLAQERLLQPATSTKCSPLQPIASSSRVTLKDMKNVGF